MADSVHIAPEVDPLRLTFCPQCDYSLQTLPEEGICPECGRHYDQSYVILRGYPVSGEAMAIDGFNLRSLIWTIIVFAAMLVLLPRQFLHDPVIIFLLIYLGCVVIVTLMTWLFSPRRGGSLVWISPAGIGQQNELDPNSPMLLWRRLLPVLHNIGYAAALAISLSQNQPMRWAVIYATFLAGLFCGIGWLARVGKPKQILKPEGARPGIMAWSTLDTIRIKHLRNGRYRLLAEHTSWVKKSWPIDLRFEATSPFINALSDRIGDWSGRTPTV